MILAGDFIPKNLNVRLLDEFKGQLVLANLEGLVCADGLPRSNKVGVSSSSCSAFVMKYRILTTVL